MAKNVLISFVGKGLPAGKNEDKEKGSYYRTADYVIKVDGKDRQFTSHIFLEALLESKAYDFSEIYLIGTETSTWSMLIYDLAQEDEAAKNLWDGLEERSKNGFGIEEEQKSELNRMLNKKYGVPVYVLTHTEDIEEDVVGEVFDFYNEIAKSIPQSSNIIFDITHGFRSMPLLAYQSLLYNSATQNDSATREPREINIIYGQFNNGGQSYVRDLKNYWELSQGTLAAKMFQEKYDASLLKKTTEHYCKPLAGLFAEFDNIVRFNLSYSVRPFVNGVQQILDQNPLNETWPDWLKISYKELADVVDFVGVNKLESEVLRNFSKLMRKKGLLVQSIIALRCAFESKIVEQVDVSKVGNYKVWERIQRNAFDEIGRRDPRLKSAMYGLQDLRNHVAHGGAMKVREFKDIEKQLRESEKNLKTFFKFVDQGKFDFKKEG